ncbi:MAG: hypothetical protein ACRYFX_18555 [Janthinobacterium lividum]
MSAKIYHFCQSCKKQISPSMNDGRLLERDQVANYNKYVDSVQAKRVLSCACPKCGKPWKLKLLYIGTRSMAKASRVSKVLRELQTPDRTGWTNRYANYKKLQQRKGGENNPIRNEQERMAAYHYMRLRGRRP